MHDTHSSFTSGNPGAYPNFVYKQKLVPLPLFNQNRSPKSVIYRSPQKERSPFGFRTQTNGFNSPSARADPYSRIRTIAGTQPQVPTSPKSPNFRVSNELRTINNYGRLCDQPFVEFSSFHFKQVFGSGNGKRNPSLEPLNRKNNKKKISKLGTLEASNLKSPITVHDSASQSQPQPPKEHKIRNQDKDNHSIIKKVYKIGEYEAIVGFYSLEVVFVPVNGQNQDKISVLLGRDDLKRVYKYPHNHVVNAVASSLVHKDRWIQQPIKKDKSLKCNIYTGEETYPQQKDGLTAVIGGQEYAATIHYPYLDIAIKELNYTEKMMLRPEYLANLFVEKFDNLQDYIQKFTLPAETYKNKQELHNDELKKLPSIIKKVLKDVDISGLIIFKSLEIHLKNTSDIEPETIMGESKLTPLNQKILRKRKKDVNNVLLRLEISDLEKLTRATGDEITELIKESVIVEEAAGFLIKLDEHKTTILNDRKHPKVDELPDYSEKFTLRFQRFLYEGYIKFPTLELYVPETNYKDIIQLKPSQLQELMNNGFENMQDFLKDFKPPEIQVNNEDNAEAEQKVTSDDPVEEVISKDVSPGEGKKFTFNQYSINVESSS